ncbi:SRPBCC domain-containing protein [Mucilaginibacter sp. 22184]|uniref:SRPBCC domain-containing protein n=1 Tax=Mucilaginibacter sp. 22184 TaxID=3453887 RepID=UPI003F868241
MKNDKILFPVGFEPANSPVFVHNEIQINATPREVWDWLTNAPTWPDWYFNAANVEIVGSNGDHLVKGSVFKWKTFGNTLQSEVKEYVPNERIAWLALGTGIKAYHAWLIIPNGSGCKVVTEETQHGWLCRLGKVLFPKRMYNYHQIWLEGLKAKAEIN